MYYTYAQNLCCAQWGMLLIFQQFIQTFLSFTSTRQYMGKYSSDGIMNGIITILTPENVILGTKIEILGGLEAKIFVLIGLYMAVILDSKMATFCDLEKVAPIKN